jgi:hypothetical protein
MKKLKDFTSIEKPNILKKSVNINNYLKIPGIKKPFIKRLLYLCEYTRGIS